MAKNQIFLNLKSNILFFISLKIYKIMYILYIINTFMIYKIFQENIIYSFLRNKYYILYKLYKQFQNRYINYIYIFNNNIIVSKILNY